MNITQTITINKSADQIWQLIGQDFDKAYLWMAPIPKSTALGRGQGKGGAPMQGRICDLSDNPEGAKVKEVITQYDSRSKTIAFDVLPINNPAIVPIRQNHVRMQVRQISHNKSQVVWTASPQLKPFAYIFYPLLRLVFPVAFGKLLKGLKDYAEKTTLVTTSA